MLEGLAAWVLNTYVGEYVENLNTDQLSIGLLQGQVELENLPLKKDALSQLELPIDVKTGFIGKICLQIPLRRLKSQPWVISMERLYLVAGPLKNRTYDEAAAKKAEMNLKKEQLKEFEDKWKYKYCGATNESSGYSSWWSYGTSLATNIMENLQLKVRDVHLRYEDSTTIPGKTFACGITIKDLSAQSTDGEWIPSYVSNTETDMMHKLLDLKNFSIYWDVDSAQYGDMAREELYDVLSRQMGQSASGGQFKEHEYLLEPVSGQAKMKRNTSAMKLKSPNSPRIHLDTNLDKISLSLSQSQYRMAMAMTKEFSRHNKGVKYRQWRPLDTVKEDAKGWWKFAIDSNLHFIHEKNKRSTADFMVRRAHDSVKYVKAYTQYLQKGGTYYMDYDLKDHLEVIEDEWTFEELQILRQLVFDRFEKEKMFPKGYETSPQALSGSSLATTPNIPNAGVSSSVDPFESTSPSDSLTSSPTEEEQQPGIFQRWFPGWGGWYGYGPPPTSDAPRTESLSTSKSEEMLTPLTSPIHSDPGTPVHAPTLAKAASVEQTESDKEIEKEIMDVLADSAENNTLLKRDVVFAKMNFCLKSGIFRILMNDTAEDSTSPSNYKGLEMECTTIKMGLESRPRTSGLKFNINVGGLFLRDKITEGSILPVLISPQTREKVTNQPRLFSSILSGLGRSPPLQTTSLFSPIPETDNNSIFEFTYDKRPLNSNADYKVEMKTKPLDIIHNADIFKKLSEFFTRKHSGFSSEKSELQLGVLAKHRYEQIKRETEKELKQTLDDLLENDNKIKAKRWEIDMDIAAPQFIIPESFTDKNTTIVMFDLGRLEFHNSNASLKEDENVRDAEDDDDFVTPSSSPPGEPEKEEIADENQQGQPENLSDLFPNSVSESAIMERIYDKYTLNLSELQVMVGRAKDNWKHAHNKGTSHMHVVDKFSISLQLERRLLRTSDPQWPKMTLSGTLPKLTLHFNEQKMQSLGMVGKMLAWPESPGSPASEKTSPQNAETGMSSLSQQQLSRSLLSLNEDPSDQKAKQAVAESCLILTQFCINEVSLEVQSRGRSIAELQVSGVKANFTKRPFDTSISFTVHSLLVVDALQTFGADFELLVASHRNLCLDSRSGSIRDSYPGSPQSPESPSSPTEHDIPNPKTSFHAVQSAVSNALQGLISPNQGEAFVNSPFGSPRSSEGSFLPRQLFASSPVHDDEALIRMEVDIIAPNCPSNTSRELLQIACLQFNNLDIVANQQTIVEMLAFFKRILPNDKDKNRDGSKKSEFAGAKQASANAIETDTKLTVTADFHRLNVLLMRVEENNSHLVAHKVATATLSRSKIEAEYADELEVKGSIGGLQVLDLTHNMKGHHHHQKILSLGTDPDVAFLHLNTQSSSQNVPDNESSEKAFELTLFKSCPATTAFDEDSPDEARVTLRMASLCYTHSAAFTKDLSLCLSEFSDYMKTVGSTIRHAAAEVAMGFVQGKSEFLSTSLYGGNMHLDNSVEDVRRKRLSSIGPDGRESVEVLDPETQIPERLTEIKLDIILQTPVLMIPRRPLSPEVLVMHLGNISIKNSKAEEHSMFFTEYSSDKTSKSGRFDEIDLEIRDMNMYSMNLDKQRQFQQSAKKGQTMTTSVFSTPQPGGYIKTSYGIPILHDTVLEVTINRNEPDEHFINQDSVFEMDLKNEDKSPADVDSVINVTGRVVTPLKLTLSKEIYEQMLQTLDHITPEDDAPPPPKMSADLGASMENSDVKFSSLSFNDVPKYNKQNETKEDSASKIVTIIADFVMPDFEVLMTDYLKEGEHGFLNLKLQDLKVHYLRDDPHVKSFELSLYSLVMEDLLEPVDSKHRLLMESSAPDTLDVGRRYSLSSRPYLSSSCPTSMIELQEQEMPRSLPSSFHTANVFEMQRTWARNPWANGGTNRKSTEDYPCTPPPSPQQSRRASEDSEQDEGLVHMKVKLVDPKSPAFESKYNKTNRFIDVNFNCLDTTINLQTWVVLLDFLGMGAKVHSPEKFGAKSETSVVNAPRPETPTEGEVVNSHINLKVQRLSLTMNKEEYELGRADVKMFQSVVDLRDCNFGIKGQLGSISLLDQSPHGELYRERFITMGSQALDFHIFKYGLPDPDLKRPHDIMVHLRMASICYTHTQRFLQETLAFIQYFNQLQDVLGRMRAAAAGQELMTTAFRASRMSFDIEAGSPIILIPHSSKSKDILVMDLGTMTVKNRFLHSGEPGSLEGKRQPSKQNETQASASKDGPEVLIESQNVTTTSTDGLGASHSSSFSEQSSMTQSVYGSLDSDWRNMEFESLSDTLESSVDAPAGKDFPHLDLGFQTTSISSDFKSFMADIDPSVSGIPSPRKSSGSSPSSDHGDTQSHQTSPDGSIKSPISAGSEDPENYCCLLDCMDITLADMDLFSAVWMSSGDVRPLNTDLVFPSFVAVRQGRKLLKEKCKLDLQVERNLEGDISHTVPDFNIEGGLSSVHCSIDLDQYKLIRGLLEHNLGEAQEEYSKPMLSHLQDPKIQTILSGEVWKSMAILLHLKNVTVQLLTVHEQSDCPEVSLAKFDFLRSKLTYESYSDGSKDVDLVSNEIMVYDTRYQDLPANDRPNVFTNILHVTKEHTNNNDLQMELHYRSTKERTRFTILLNNMRVMGIFDWLLLVKDFLLTSAENPFKTAEDDLTDHQEKDQGRKMTTSTYSNVSTGIVTKRAPIVEKVETPFELKLNVTDTELICVANAAMWDTNAVILKTTAVFSLRPNFAERPVSCSLQSLEVFSCSLAAEDETALSIIDPVTVTLELANNPLFHQRNTRTAGLLDVHGHENKPPILEVSFSTLNIRLSYNDLQLFMEILNSVPKQALEAARAGEKKELPKNASAADDRKHMRSVQLKEDECVKALVDITGQNEIDKSAVKSPKKSSSEALEKKEQSGTFSISGFEVKAGSICFCLIDDCLDADVPLAEITFSNIHVLQKVNERREGKGSMKTTIDYYNRILSGWEPFLESWPSHVEWAITAGEKEKHLTMQWYAGETLNLNVTSVLLEQYRQTKSKWTEDYYSHWSSSGEQAISYHRRRVPFIPFAIRNHTGCPLWFATVTTTPTRIILSSESQRKASHFQVSEWRQVHPDGELSFLIEEREKIRHKHTHELKVHQVVVKVAGWREVDPVSVDKVGTYFRQAKPEIDNTSGIFQEVPPARVVFDVSLEGSAKKVITVRSALMLDNRLEDPVDIKLEDTAPGVVREVGMMRIQPRSKQAVPLPNVMCKLQVRPVGWSLNYAKKPILWQHVLRPGEVNNSMMYCSTPGGDQEQASYRFCVSVYRQKYPEDFATSKISSVSQAIAFVQPGHVITLMPPVRVVNLLPMDIIYYFNNTDIRGIISPNKTASVLLVDLSQPLELGIQLENFPSCKELVIPPGTQNYEVKLRLYDTSDRLLELQVHIKAGVGGSLKLTIYAPFWLVNKSGLPLVFRQDNARQDAAGQFDEHEHARSVMPLLFSYADKDANTSCTMRLGRTVHGQKSVPKWCLRFSLSRGEGVRQLHVAQFTSRPDLVYYIGIEARQGRGRYRNTTIVTFSPRYQLDNRTSFRLSFAQRNFTTAESTGRENHLSALEGCQLSFHWPRVDLDQLMCVKINNISACHWSGGFRIDQVNSFHINMRDEDFRCHFLRVDIVLQRATFYVFFADASHMPPPYRIDNFAEVPIIYFQTKVSDEKLRTSIKPQTSVPYALDEPTLPPYITLSVPGGSSATYSLNSNTEGDVLCYENFFYIAFSGTLKETLDMDQPRPAPKGYDNFVRSQELVLDVLPNNKVVMKKMEKGRRSQLWRMTAQGQLKHEGSASPSCPNQGNTSATSYVLDIADIALQPNRDVELMIRKMDQRRRSTQTWKFQNGKLCIDSGNLCVQSKEGFFGLQDGGVAVLGPFPTFKDIRHVPVEMAVSRVRMRPGSGHLRVSVINDGPTRVLQITDTGSKPKKKDDWVVVEGHSGILTTRESPQKFRAKAAVKADDDFKIRLQAKIILPNGIGVSLVNHLPEELVYINLRGIEMAYSSCDDGKSFSTVVRQIQVDNQLFGTSRPVMMYMTQESPTQASPMGVMPPAIQICAHKMPSHPQWNADIYSSLIVTICRLTVNIEETLLWKLVQFAGYSGSEKALEVVIEESSFNSQRALLAATSKQFKRYYFGELAIMTDRLTLSCHTADDLPGDLGSTKKSTAIPLVQFEEAHVELDHYVKYGPFETAALMFESLSLHYTEELKSQAAKILGSVDFLGNPLGLFNDVTTGLSGLIKDGNVGGLIKNVTHGVSNTAAKVAESLSDGVGYLTVDESHEKKRRQIRNEGSAGSSHIIAGIRGLGHGIFGGATSIVTQTYTGLRSDGIEGLVTGFGKGVIGTVTKPVAGMLDFASSAASAVRDRSRSSNHRMPSRMRVSRCCHGPRGLLPSFSEHHARAQAYLFVINKYKYDEMFIAIEQLRFRAEESLQVLISSQQVYFLGRDPNSQNVVLQTTYDKLYHCRSVMIDGKYYIELTMKAETELGVQTNDPRRRPRIRCDSEAISIKVSQQVNYAKSMFEELRQTLAEEGMYVTED